jgi:hypothetical protein
MNGADVVALQERLLELGYPLPEYGTDGWFGPETDAAVRDFSAVVAWPSMATSPHAHPAPHWFSPQKQVVFTEKTACSRSENNMVGE